MFEGEKIFEGVLPRTKYDSKWLKELMKELKEIKIDKKSAKDKALIVFIYLKLRELRKITKEIKKSM
ncbi:MAG: hypothetical protein KAQ85_11530, partial [Thermodesulfovibrionia bacterium]|nr:hypothetical protein [Thermodesulfovibrionia bacterium]